MTSSNSSQEKIKEWNSYPSYKDSGVEWLGKIPAHWEVKRLRFLSFLNPSKSELLLGEDIEVNFIPMEKISYEGSLVLDEIRKIKDVYSSFTYFRNFDVLVAKITPCFENRKGALVIGLMNGVGFGTTELHVIRAKQELDSRFLWYKTVSGPFRMLGELEMKGTAGQKRIPEEYIKDFESPVPPFDEQKKIVIFLDRETAKIDALIKKKERLVELLQEKRTALISHAVTKGLDLKVPMKDSGLEWLGKIPTHWEVKRLKIIASVELSNVDKKSNEGEVPVKLCNYTDVYYNERITANMDFMEATATPDQMRKFSLQAGDVLITKDSELWTDIAVPAVVTQNLEGVVCGYHLAHIRLKPESNGSFLARAFGAIGPRDQFQIAANGITRFGLTGDAIKSSKFGVPPISEQRSIVAFLDHETGKIDALIKKIQEAIKRLKEYRTALISAAVTGEIDVREEVG